MICLFLSFPFDLFYSLSRIPQNLAFIQSEQLATPENTIILFVCPPKFGISIVSSLSWDLQWSQEKTKTMLMQNLGGQTKSIMVFSEVAYYDKVLDFNKLFALRPSWSTYDKGTTADIGYKIGLECLAPGHP